jgi:hypothetical protein
VTELVWDQAGERTYETGVERGVLFPESGPGVPWNGLVSVQEKSGAISATPLYFEGDKYLDLASYQDFAATIEAFTYPDEFEACEGSLEVMPGFLASQQRQQTFGLCYRTKIGNDIDGSDHGYKLHLVYNALATPADRAYTTDSSTPNAMTFQWDISTTPVAVPGFKATAHLVMDSRRVSPFALDYLESILYGFSAPARLPLPTEIVGFPWGQREILVLQNPDANDLPEYALSGDAVFVVSNEEVYSVNDPSISSNVRPVISIPTLDMSLLPITALPGDLVYVEDTGDLFRLEE